MIEINDVYLRTDFYNQGDKVGTYYNGSYLDELSTLYQIDAQTHDLWIYLPHNTTAVVRNWDNGRAGIMLSNMPAANLSDWNSLTKANTVNDGLDWNISDLQGRVSALNNVGSYSVESAFLQTSALPPLGFTNYDFTSMVSGSIEWGPFPNGYFDGTMMS